MPMLTYLFSSYVYFSVGELFASITRLRNAYTRTWILSSDTVCFPYTRSSDRLRSPCCSLVTPHVKRIGQVYFNGRPSFVLIDVADICWMDCESSRSIDYRRQVWNVMDRSTVTSARGPLNVVAAFITCDFSDSEDSITSNFQRSLRQTSERRSANDAI